MAEFLRSYDAILHGVLCKYVALSEEIGGVVKDQAHIVKSVFACQKVFLNIVPHCKKPDTDILTQLVKPTSNKLKEVEAHRDKNRSSQYFNHLSCVSESIGAICWVAILPDPSKYVMELHAAGAYYGNKVITAHKNKNDTHVEWAKTWLLVISELHAHIKEFHRCGVAWNPQGAYPTSHSLHDYGSEPIAESQSYGQPPPPPPPPELFASTGFGPSGDDPRAALFKEINQGADITKCLKKVDLNEKKVKTAPLLKHEPMEKPKKQSHPPKFELDGRKWRIEYHQNADVAIPETSINQSVSVYQCNNCVLNVQEKVNCITLDSCKKTSIVFSDIVSFVEFINCQDMKAQSMGKVPTITIDKTDGCEVYLSASGLDVEIVSSKSSAINVLTPVDGDFVEFPVPEQFKSTVQGKTLKTVVVEKV